MDDYAIIFLFVLILACITYISSIIIKNNLLDNNNSITKKEGFLDYQDVKTKTLNWCNKMQQTGLLSADQFNQCVSSFKDTTAGLVSSGIGTDSKYGMGMDYSIYNTRAKQLSSSITNTNADGGNNTNTIMLMTPNNQTLACKPDGSLYQVPNTDDPQVNQKELYFTLTPINETAFAILSPYGTFLAADNTYNASMTGKSIGPLSTWNIVKITSSTASSANVSQVMIESSQFPGFHLVYDSTLNTLSIQQGQNESMIWSISAKASNDNTLLTKTSVLGNTLLTKTSVLGNTLLTKTSVLGNTPDSELAMNVSQYTVLKESILAGYKNNAMMNIALQASIDTIKKLQSLVSNNYADITNYIQNYLQNQQRLYQLSSSDYKTRTESIRNNSMINPDTQQNLINNLPAIQGLNVSSDTINQVLSAINNQKNITLQYITNNALLPLQQQIGALGANDNTLVDYNKFIGTLQATLQDTNNQIAQNKKILERQKDKYNAINADYSYQLNKISKLEKVDNVAGLNVDLLSNYREQKGYLTKIYPVCIFLLIIGFIYLTYLTYKKFIDNVWSQYKD